MKPAALALSALLLLSGPLAAQTADGAPGERDQVLEAFTRLVDRGEARTLFGLPQEAFWRRSGDLSLALFAARTDDLRPVLEGAAAPFADATGVDIAVVESGPAVPNDQDPAALAPEADLVIVVGPRQDLAQIAAAGDFNKGMLARFELGTWPFMFTFEANQRRRGVVLLADDEPERAREAAFILVTVWGLGGVTLGPELTGLVSDSDDGPQLTPRGEAVFRLLFHEDLKNGMPLADAVTRAGTLLPR